MLTKKKALYFEDLSTSTIHEYKDKVLTELGKDIFRAEKQALAEGRQWVKAVTIIENVKAMRQEEFSINPDIFRYEMEIYPLTPKYLKHIARGYLVESQDLGEMTDFMLKENPDTIEGIEDACERVKTLMLESLSSIEYKVIKLGSHEYGFLVLIEKNSK